MEKLAVVLQLVVMFLFWRFVFRKIRGHREKKETLNIGSPVNPHYSSIFKPNYGYSTLEVDTQNGLFRVGANGDIISFSDVSELYTTIDDLLGSEKTDEYMYVDVISGQVSGKVALHLILKNGQSVSKVLRKVTFPANQKGGFISGKTYTYDIDEDIIELRKILDTCMFREKNNIPTYEEAKNKYKMYVNDQFRMIGFSSNFEKVSEAMLMKRLENAWKYDETLTEEERKAYLDKLREAQEICQKYIRIGLQH